MSDKYTSILSVLPIGHGFIIMMKTDREFASKINGEVILQLSFLRNVF